MALFKKFDGNEIGGTPISLAVMATEDGIKRIAASRCNVQRGAASKMRRPVRPSTPSERSPIAEMTTRRIAASSRS
jgi:hypothetical protein